MKILELTTSRGYKLDMKSKTFMVNASSEVKQVMIQCATAVNRDAVRRESIDGIEHIIVSSFTLPDDIVMNGGLYPAEEIKAGFHTLERTLAPVEHPTDGDGNFLSANDPVSIHNFYAGAYNVNVTREDGRVHIEKFINVQEAIKSDRGKRLLDRINELETNDNPRPLHTSVGVFLNVEPTDGPQTNAAGEEYHWVARNMVFDHDAILLDSVAAAQPGQGVGMAVNADGKECEVQRFDLNAAASQPKIDRVCLISELRDNQGDQSISEIHEAVQKAFEKSAIDASWIEELFEDRVVFWSKDELFEVPYRIDNGIATIVGIPLPVERNVTFTPKVNTTEGDSMKELILNALKEAGIDVTDMDEDALFAAYNQLQATPPVGEGEGDDKGIAETVANAITGALKPFTERLDGVETKLNQADTDEIASLVGIVVNSDKYPGLTEDGAKALPVEELKSMAANCGTGYGVPLAINNKPVTAGQAPAEMPE